MIRSLVSNIRDPKERNKQILHYAMHPEEVGVDLGKRFDGHTKINLPKSEGEPVIIKLPKPERKRAVKPSVKEWMKGLFQ